MAKANIDLTSKRRGEGDRRYRHIPISAQQIVKLASEPVKGPPRLGLQFLVSNSKFSGEDCLIWPLYRDRQGYGRVGIQGKVFIPHRIMCVLAHGAPPTDDHVASHTCGNGYRGCVNPRHLEWATEAENHASKVRSGRLARGEKHYRAKLSSVDVEEIRSRTYGWGDIRRVAEKYGVSHATISRVLQRDSYRG